MLLRAGAIQREGVFVQLEATVLGYILLTAFNFSVEEFFHHAAVQTHQMIMMGPFVELEHGFARLEVTARQQPRLLELREHAVDGGKTDVEFLVQQVSIYVFCSQVTHRTMLENLKYLEPGQGCLQPDIFRSAGLVIARHP